MEGVGQSVEGLQRSVDSQRRVVRVNCLVAFIVVCRLVIVERHALSCLSQVSIEDAIHI